MLQPLPPFLGMLNSPILSPLQLIWPIAYGRKFRSFPDALYVGYICFMICFLIPLLPIAFREHSFSRASQFFRIAFLRQLLLVFASPTLLFLKTKKEKCVWGGDKIILLSPEEAIWEERPGCPVTLHFKQEVLLMMRITLAWVELSPWTLST